MTEITEVTAMMYPFMTLSDNTEIVHSELLPDEKVKVYIEKPIYNGFKSAECYIPGYEWKNVDGFTKAELKYYDELIHSVSHVILELSEEGGIENAANF